MPIDQPANPRIRTKVNILDEKIDEEFFNIAERLRAGEVSVEDYQVETLKFLEKLHINSTFERDIALARASAEQHWLVRRHTDECRYTLLFASVAAGEVHPPHQHFNLISTQVVIEGHIHLREYQRIRYDENNQLIVQMLRDETLGPGDAFQASEWHRNVHWFCAVDGPALIFNVNVRGYENSTFDTNDDGPFGRRYLDPTKFTPDGLIACPSFDEDEAERRFQGRPLANFPAPIPVDINPDKLSLTL